MAAPARRIDREFISRSGDHHALRIWLRLLTCTQLIERQVRSRLRGRFGTTLPRFDLLAQLERHAEGLKMNELSRLLMVTGGNVTGLTDELARDGLVSREASPGDRRAWIVRLTPKGRSAFTAMAEEHERWIRELFAGFDSEAVAALHAQLGTLRVHLLDKLKPSEAETT
jgi:DNA-binding MarR family transcriptional regulator